MDIVPLTNLRGPAARITSVTAESIPAGEPAAVDMTGPDQSRQFKFKVPRGLPGVNAIENDTAVAGYIGAGDSATSHALGDTARMVYHGTNGGTPRPSGVRPVLWIGTAFPVNSVIGDVHLLPDHNEDDWGPNWVDLVAWYDPSQLGLANGATVSSIPDLSGRGNDLNTASGTVTIDATTLVQPALTFTGTQHLSSDLLDQQWSMPTRVYMIAKPNNPGTAMTMFDTAGALTGGNGRAVMWMDATRHFSLGQGAANLVGTLVIPTSGPSVLSGVFTGATQTRGYVNTTLRVMPGSAGSGVPKRHRIGARYDGASPYSGLLGEVLVARNVTDDDHARMVAYLVAKWGVTV